jgi:hypothetical protein
VSDGFPVGLLSQVRDDGTPFLAGDNRLSKDFVALVVGNVGQVKGELGIAAMGTFEFVHEYLRFDYRRDRFGAVGSGS